MSCHDLLTVRYIFCTIYLRLDVFFLVPLSVTFISLVTLKRLKKLQYSCRETAFIGGCIITVTKHFHRQQNVKCSLNVYIEAL